LVEQRFGEAEIFGMQDFGQEKILGGAALQRCDKQSGEPGL
jgi:hypothetical protein